MFVTASRVSWQKKNKNYGTTKIVAELHELSAYKIIMQQVKLS